MRAQVEAAREAGATQHVLVGEAKRDVERVVPRNSLVVSSRLSAETRKFLPQPLRWRSRAAPLEESYADVLFRSVRAAPLEASYAA